MRGKAWHKTKKVWITDELLLNFKDGKLYRWIHYNVRPIHGVEVKNIVVTWVVDEKDKIENLDGMTEAEREDVRYDHVEGDKE